ncbi:MAG: DUF3817 domain-containing protein [Actinomycetota bacterium]|nr:DUF3817 domain-containing protein [Actinomycetota bacterium]
MTSVPAGVAADEAFRARRNRQALLRYRIMAITTGVLLAVCTFIALPLKYLFDQPALSLLWVLHGFLFPVYLVTAADLGLRRRWNWLKLGLVLISGTIPLLVFFVERRVTAEEQGR